MIFVLVVALGRFVSASEVKAASVVNSYCGATVTIKNAQLVIDVPARLADDEDMYYPEETKIYVVNEATSLEFSMNDKAQNDHVTAAYSFQKVTSVADGTVDFYDNGFIGSSFTTAIEKEMKAQSANLYELSYGRGFGVDRTGMVALLTPSLAREYGVIVQGTSTDGTNCTMNRLYNPNAGDHHYTVSEAERDNLVRLGWNDEGIGWYSNEFDTTTLYRLYNPNATGAGAHRYTTNSAEVDYLKSIGWRYEGTAWYGL